MRRMALILLICLIFPVMKQQGIDALSKQCADPRTLAANESELLYFSFSHSGMSMEACYSYTVLRTERGCRADYELYCGRTGFSLFLDEEDAGLLTDTINSLAAWDGFCETNSQVLDGEGFGLHIEYADGTVVSAYGNNAFPYGYSGAVSAIKDLFLALMEKNNISIDE